MQRMVVLDGFRGIFLFFMTVIHLNTLLGVTLGKLNHHYFGWVEDAQGFVFISGLVVGCVYGKKYLRQGYDALKLAIWQRIRTIYSHQAGLVLILAAVAAALASQGLSVPALSAYVEDPIATLMASLALVGGTANMGILPMYIWFMMITPWIMKAFAQGYAWTVLGFCILSWAFAQTGLASWGKKALLHAWAEQGYQAPLGIFFDVWGWQLLFFGGLYLGWRLSRQDLPLDWLKRREFAALAGVALLGIVLFGLFDRLVFDFWVSEAFSSQVLAATDRGALSWIYVVTFVIDLYFVTWLMVAGPESRHAPVRHLAKLLVWCVTLRPMVFLGQHSLHVFSWHILLFYTLACILPFVSWGEAERSLVLCVGVVSLAIPSLGHAWLQTREREKRDKVGMRS